MAHEHLEKKIIGYINDLNQTGLELSEGAERDLNEAQNLHLGAHAVFKSFETKLGLNLDYMAFSAANMAYCLRQKGLRDAAMEVLTTAFDAYEKRITEDNDSQCGFARLLEETGLVRRFNTNPEDPFTDLQQGLNEEEMAAASYEEALESPDIEIISKEEITNRLNRTYGLVSMVALELARLGDTNEEVNHFKQTALKYCEKEVTGRESAGENSGQALANAYHTMAVVNTDLENFVEAGENLDKVEKLTTSERTKATLPFRRAWLSYKANEERPLTANHLDVFLNGVNDLTEGDKNNIKPQLLELGDRIGGPYQEKISSLYNN
jgi:tetratricopeptide (TPR) repeat protein